MQLYDTIPYNEEISYKEDIIIILSNFMVALLAFLLGVLAVLRINRKRITNLFTVRWGNIYQDVNKDGCAYLKSERLKLGDKTIDAKLFAMAKVFTRQLTIVLKKLEVGKIYKTKTHILSTMKKAEKKKEIIIDNYQKAGKRILIESIWFLGRKDFLKLIFSKDSNILYKQFYNIKFTRL